MRIREYPRSQLFVTLQLNLDSYRPGDTIFGKIDVKNSDGAPFQPDVPLTYSYNVDFQSPTQHVVEASGQSLSQEGVGFFQIKVPNDT